MYKIAIDVGGTNTDAVLCDIGGKILNKVKVNTTFDIQTGIENAISCVVRDMNIDLSKVKFAMLGTTQCTNAIIERKKLKKVTAIRLASNCTKAITPFCDWPTDLKDVVCEDYIITDGGYEYDGKVLGEINFDDIHKVVEKSVTKNFAVSCVYSPLNDEQEQALRAYILKICPEANVSISSEIGALSLLERENATILNSSLKDVMDLVALGFNAGLQKVGITNAQVYICQNDGTVMNINYAQKHPILTISSGPTNSIRGGAKLVQKENAIIVDIGGTTTDVGAIVNSLARESQGTSDIGGVDSNFRMPDMVSIGLGGGTIVNMKGDEVIIGPESVGHELVKRALCFGGDTLTLSDIAVRLGRIKMGTFDIKDLVDLSLAQRVDEIVNERIKGTIDLMKLNGDKADIILVGGGSIIVNEKTFDYDILNIPKNHDVANAIGASIAQVSGSHEGVYSMKNQDHDAQVNKAINLAKENAIKSGAKADTLKVVDIEQIPLSYHPEEAYVIKIKVIGDMN